MSRYEYETYNIPDRDYYPGIEDEPDPAEPTEPPEPDDQRGSPTMNENLILVTDSRGNPVLEGDDCVEPLPGSVLLTDGEFGTAWQRYFNDGLWHRVGGGSGKPWSFFLTKRNVVLVYDALERGAR